MTKYQIEKYLNSVNSDIIHIKELRKNNFKEIEIFKNSIYTGITIEELVYDPFTEYINYKKGLLNDIKQIIKLIKNLIDPKWEIISLEYNLQSIKKILEKKQHNCIIS